MAKNYNKKQFDPYDYINNIIISQLKQAQEKIEPYLVSSERSPFNPITQTVYEGVNYLTLSIRAEQRSLRYNSWATYNQIQKAGGKLKVGAKHEKILKWERIYLDDNKNNISKEKYLELIDTGKHKDITSKSYIKYFMVFNLDQVEGLNHLRDKDFKLNYHFDQERNKLAETFIKSTKATIIHKSDIESPSYEPRADLIKTYPIEHFKNKEGYYSVLFHELSHWSGHESRLNRFAKLESLSPKEIAFEEFIAEISSTYLCARFGIQKEIKDCTKYINTWNLILNADKKALLNAISASSTCFSYLQSLDSTLKIENVKKLVFEYSRDLNKNKKSAIKINIPKFKIPKAGEKIEVSIKEKNKGISL